MGIAGIKNKSLVKKVRTDFTDRQKAEIFVRDRAICCFSGKSLWVLDHGVSPLVQVDWADHIKPAMRGGESSVENGICTSHFYNGKKTDNSRDNKYFFKAGLPTEYYYFFHGKVNPATAYLLNRNKSMHYSDWYLNRAYIRFWWIVYQMRLRTRGKVGSRDEDYYAKSAVTMLKTWRKIAVEQNVDSVEKRGLVPSILTPDKATMLSIRDISTPDEALFKANSVFKYYAHSCDALNSLSGLSKHYDAVLLLEQMSTDEYVLPDVREIVSYNIESLFQFTG